MVVEEVTVGAGIKVARTELWGLKGVSWECGLFKGVVMATNEQGSSFTTSKMELDSKGWN